MTTASPHRVIAAPQSEVTSSLVRRSVWLSIEGDGIRVPNKYGRSEFRPESVILGWTNRDDSPDWKLVTAEVAGTVWKKDGTVGLVTTRRDFAGQIADAPDWLISLVLAHGPFAQVKTP